MEVVRQVSRSFAFAAPAMSTLQLAVECIDLSKNLSLKIPAVEMASLLELSEATVSRARHHC